MTAQRSRPEIDRRLDEVRSKLRDHHAGIEPDAQFAARIVQLLPRSEGWSIDWAARRVLPVSIALALGLIVAVVVTDRSSGPRIAATSSSPASQTGTDPLEWLLESRQDVR